jgi:hypothetical protein
MRVKYINGAKQESILDVTREEFIHGDFAADYHTALEASGMSRSRFDRSLKDNFNMFFPADLTTERGTVQSVEIL